MRCVIIGAGKIARGFLGHLLYLSNIPFLFVEKNQRLVDLINERKEYTVNVLGDSSKNCVVKNVQALSFFEEERIIQEIAGAQLVFTSVGGKNLTGLVELLTRAIEKKAETDAYLNIITCENWKQPAQILKQGVGAEIDKEAEEYFKTRVGFSEAVIMRSGIEADKELLDKDPLTVNVQDYWQLPIDASRLAGPLPDIMGVTLIEEFTGFLERKFYTYNAANGTTSYLGALLGYEKIADAAHDERILEVLEGVYQETARALSIKHDLPLEEQLEFTLTSKRKLQDYTIVDFIERNARDPIRKLGKDDRLVGSARLVLEHGITPHNLATAIAAAIYYENPEDESACKLVRMRKEKGVDFCLQNICEVEPDSELGGLIKEKIQLLRKRGWIKE